jgi:hypothetical protein
MGPSMNRLHMLGGGRPPKGNTRNRESELSSRSATLWLKSSQIRVHWSAVLWMYTSSRNAAMEGGVFTGNLYSAKTTRVLSSSGICISVITDKSRTYKVCKHN